MPNNSYLGYWHLDRDRDVTDTQIIANYDDSKVTKIINYSSEKIELVSDHTLDLIKKYPINVTFVYSIRSAEALTNIINNYSLAPIMTQSRLMCISNKIANYFRKLGWKKIEVFNPGEEIIKLGNY